MIKSIEDGRKEDGNRSIADKIIKRLHDLEKTVQSNHGRWAWELLQNAKDSVAETGRKVSVRVTLNEKGLRFEHNGSPFNERDIRGLINQISSKEVEEGVQTTRTGRFGTGFLTTHLLSKVVFIEGVVVTDDGDYYNFRFPLDRDASKTPLLVPKIEQAWQAFHYSTDQAKIDEFDEDSLNTSFLYQLLTPKQQEIAKVGMEEFKALIPYVLTFIPEIENIEIIDSLEDDHITFSNHLPVSDGFKIIERTRNGQTLNIRLLTASSSRVAIAARVRKKGDVFEVQDMEDIPKLFCDFPLIGTEGFYFPVIVNSFFFNPQTERDGVWLLGDEDDEVLENMGILEEAVELFKELIDSITMSSFKKLYFLANSKMPEVDMRYFDKDWFKGSIQQPLRDFLGKSALVELEDGSFKKISEIYFPLKSYPEKVREALWTASFGMFPGLLCKKDDLHQWTALAWDSLSKLTYEEVAKDISNQKNVATLSSIFDDEADMFTWLNETGKFMIEDEANLALVEKYAMVPNANGQLMAKSKIYINKINDDQLIQALKLLGEDWGDILIHPKIRFGSYFKKEKSDIAIKITEKIKNTSPENEGFIKAVSLLSEWFDANEEEGKELFSELFRKRAELFMNTIKDKDSLYKVMRSSTDLTKLSKVAEAIDQNPQLFENLERVKEIYALMRQYDVKDIDGLKDILEGNSGPANRELLPVTQEILVNMGITSIEEWKLAIEDKDLSQLYTHTSVPTTDMFVYVQSMIRDAKKTIIAALEKLDNYDLDELDDTTAPTILAGVLKDGNPISIVARPAFNNEVIIYYGSERDILDFEPSELWVDDGLQARQITLGHVLKKAKIVKFPV